MRIVHVDFTGTYNEDMAYQENILPRMHAMDDHEVTFITTCYKWEKGSVVHTAPLDKMMADGVRLIRMEYRRIGFHKLSKYIRAVSGFYEVLSRLHPQMIMVHCLQTHALLDVVRYKKEHPQLVLFADSHSDLYNSARGIVSKYGLHKVIYKNIIRKALPYIDKIFYISLDCKDFLEQIYGIYTKLEFMPLGGELVNQIQMEALGHEVKIHLGLSHDDLMIVHSGKFDENKKTVELLRAFSAVQVSNAYLYLIGTVSEKLKDAFESIVSSNDRINYLGWMPSQELKKYLCAADLYVQPGSQSATLQNALCCGCPVLVYPYKSHIPFIMDNGVYVKTEEDMVKALKDLINEPDRLCKMGKRSSQIAEQLDYRNMARHLVQQAYSIVNSDNR